eukprot:gene4094-4648_t
MGDKFMNGRDVIKEELPQADLNICLFHLLRILRREVTIDKMGISSAEGDLSLEMLLKMANGKNLESFEQLRALLENSAPKSVVAYFPNNWDEIKDEWVEGLKKQL